MSIWQECIDIAAGRMPVIRATGCDVIYEFAIVGGLMSGELFCPSPRMRLSLRCDALGGVTARIVSVVKRVI